MCENRVPWNKGKTGLQKHSEEWKKDHSQKMKVVSKKYIRNEKGEFV